MRLAKYEMEIGSREFYMTKNDTVHVKVKVRSTGYGKQRVTAML
jgi:hypothetical protein